MCVGLRLGTLAWEAAVCKQSDPGQAAAFQKALQPRERATRGGELAGMGSLQHSVFFTLHLSGI